LIRDSKPINGSNLPFSYNTGIVRRVLMGALAIATLGAAAAALLPSNRRHFVFQQLRRPTQRAEWSRTELYIPVRDGTLLAADVFRPVPGNGAQLPLVWSYIPYHRAATGPSGLQTPLDRGPWLRDLVRHGYAVAFVDVRGTGASTGAWNGPFAPEEITDTYDVTEWFAQQTWCDGNIGMLGTSYNGSNQYCAAALAPPHLKAIVPEKALYDLYDFLYGGGAFRAFWAKEWSDAFAKMDATRAIVPVPQGGESPGLIRRPARNAFDMFVSLARRDSRDPETGEQVYTSRSPDHCLPSLNRAGIPTFIVTGWYDLFTSDAFEWYRNLTVPRRLVVGPWWHGTAEGWDSARAHLEWYDRWLKNKEIEPAQVGEVSYYVMAASPEKEGWKSARSWPPDTVSTTTLYFSPGLMAKSAGPSPERYLLSSPPERTEGDDWYTVDYSTTSGPSNRWRTAFGHYADMAANDAKGLSYTTPPLERDLEIAGMPSVTLWIAMQPTDVDIHVYLEEVNERGNSRYITEGFRRLSPERSSAEDEGEGDAHLEWVGAAARGDERLKLSMRLLPTAYRFSAGARIRLTITGADTDATPSVVHEPPPVLGISRSSDEASRLSLPTAVTHH
jgi:putative CocE/NonD family hydrolase